MYLTHYEIGELYYKEHSDWMEFVLPLVLEEELDNNPDNLIDAWLDTIAIENGKFIFQIICILKSGDNFIYSASLKQICEII